MMSLNISSPEVIMFSFARDIVATFDRTFDRYARTQQNDSFLRTSQLD